MRSRTSIGLVVPAFDQGGGVPAVALFLRRVAEAAGFGRLCVVSLATSRCDEASTLLSKPASWFGGVRCEARQWLGVDFWHVGAVFGEVEFQRYRPRAVIGRLLADCDVIQVVSGSPAWANAVLGLGKPVALQVATRARVERRWGARGEKGFERLWRAGMTNITDRLDDKALRRVDAIQVENPWMREYARAINVDRDVDIRYAPPGVDACWFRPLSVRGRMRDPYVLCVGRLRDPRKNIGLLLEAYGRFPPALQARVRLVLAGSSAPPDEFWRRAEQLGVRERIRYFANPNEDELLQLYQDATALALPSAEEGFGMVVIEAMACGIPVVATRCGGPEGIIMDGEDGFLVPLDDVGAMSSRLIELLVRPGQNISMGRAARLSIERRYDAKVAGAVFVDVWNHLLHTGVKRKLTPHATGGCGHDGEAIS